MPKNACTFRYRVHNWPEYNRALVVRGRLTFWFDEDTIAVWRNTEPASGPGTPKIYSGTAIHCALVLKSVFHLSLCATQGFLSSLMELMTLNLPVPDYTTVSRRQGSLQVSLPVRCGSRLRHVVVDATGLKVYGAGEWHLRKHRSGRHRTWRKLHLGVDETTKEIVAMDVTASNVHDSRMLPKLLSQVTGELQQVSGDGAYDTRACYQAISEHGAIATIIPRRRARYWKTTDSPGATMRNRNIRSTHELGRYEWRVSSGCTRQALAENAVSRFKRLLGAHLSARRFDNQRTEGAIKCAVLNRMASLGIPQSVRMY